MNSWLSILIIVSSGISLSSCNKTGTSSELGESQLLQDIAKRQSYDHIFQKLSAHNIKQSRSRCERSLHGSEAVADIIENWDSEIEPALRAYTSALNRAGINQIEADICEYHYSEVKGCSAYLSIGTTPPVGDVSHTQFMFRTLNLASHLARNGFYDDCSSENPRSKLEIAFDEYRNFGSVSALNYNLLIDHIPEIKKFLDNQPEIDTILISDRNYFDDGNNGNSPFDVVTPINDRSTLGALEINMASDSIPFILRAIRENNLLNLANFMDDRLSK